MVELGQTLEVQTRAEWRAWLEKHHATEPEIWLVFYYTATGKSTIDYDEAVEEALCFGWIDSTVKRIDDERRGQRFTPRRPGSPLSEMNKVRVRRLHEAGLMRPSGLAVAGAVLDEPFEIAPDILERLKEDGTVWKNFQGFPDSYQRIRIGWIETDRGRSEEFEKRLRYFLEMTAQNKRYGQVQ